MLAPAGEDTDGTHYSKMRSRLEIEIASQKVPINPRLTVPFMGWKGKEAVWGLPAYGEKRPEATPRGPCQRPASVGRAQEAVPAVQAKSPRALSSALSSHPPLSGETRGGHQLCGKRPGRAVP